MSILRAHGAVLLALGILTGCKALSPTADVTMQSAELSATRSVGNVYIAPPFGVAEAEKHADKVVLATASAAYGKRARTEAMLGGDNGRHQAMLAPYMAAYVEVLKGYDPAKPESTPKRLALPAAAHGAASPEAMSALAAAWQKADAAGLQQAVAADPRRAASVRALGLAALKRLDVDHVLLTHIAGDEHAYLAGKSIRMFASLVHVQTGAIRFVAHVDAAQTMAIPYSLCLGNMASSLYHSASELDPGVLDTIASEPLEEDIDNPVLTL